MAVAENDNENVASSSLLLSFVLLGSEPGVGIGHANVELLGAFDDQLALLRRDGVGDLGSVHAILHQQNLQIRNVVHQEFLKSVGADVFGLLVASVTDVGHFILTLEAATHSVVDTLGFSPVGFDAEEVDGLMPDELLRPLLDDLRVIQRTHHFQPSFISNFFLTVFNYTKVFPPGFPLYIYIF